MLPDKPQFAVTANRFASEVKPATRIAPAELPVCTGGRMAYFPAVYP